ncbi:MAG: ribonuclease VapC [archaeon]|nr:ribonuclease VapC [archaeon]
MVTYNVLDASAFINGFKLEDKYNLTVPEITEEIKDFQSKLILDLAIEDGKLTICDVEEEYMLHLEKTISDSGDILRLSGPDKKLIALALQAIDKGKDVKLISDDYSIPNVLKILNIRFENIITEGIKGVYNWKKVCEGCKKEFDENYPFEDCEICGSKVFKKRIKL